MKLTWRRTTRRQRSDLVLARHKCSALVLAMACGLPATAVAQTPVESGNSTMFASEPLNLRLEFPALLRKQDVNTALQDGRIAILGLTKAPGESQGSVGACLRPLLLAQTPEPLQRSTTSERPSADGSETVVTVTPAASATLLLAELDPNCLSGEEQVSGHKELPVMAQQFLATPGMAAVAQPASYTIGSQKVFMASAQGHPETPAPAGSDPTVRPAATPFTIFTMAVATTWNNHLLVWLMSANQIGLLDQVSKSRVGFGRAAEAPLYPRTMGTASPAGSSQ